MLKILIFRGVYELVVNYLSEFFFAEEIFYKIVENLNTNAEEFCLALIRITLKCNDLMKQTKVRRQQDLNGLISLALGINVIFGFYYNKKHYQN